MITKIAGITSYVPERLLIVEEARKYGLTDEIKNRIIQLNPNVQIVYSKTNQPILPENLSTEERRRYIEETLVLAVRSKGADFIEVFASPGRISENLGIMGKPISRCPLGCTFCYLQVSGKAIPWNRVYVDMDRFKEEWEKEQYVYGIAQTLWTAISFVKNKPLDKVPEGFKAICDKKIRKHVLSKRYNINSEIKAIEYLVKNIAQLFSELNINVDEKKLKIIRKKIFRWYKLNQQLHLSLNLSEYTDILGLDHITNFMDMFLGWAEKNPNLQMKLRTKAPYLDNILKHKDLSMLKITIDLNTDMHISKYHPYGYPLDERMIAANTLTESGAKVVLAIEPIIKYPGYEKDYQDLVKRIANEIDLSKVEGITIGCVRYKTTLMNYIKEAYPGTDLFDQMQNLQAPEYGDKRWRYSKEDRIKIYSDIINSLPAEYQGLVRLGAENPEIWTELGIDKSLIHKNVVKQNK